ncbi:type IV pilus modification protein PilV [Pseudomonas stutzeri]|nr:type IV pilus modification protein PilV [Stutzerimonas stutzeri]
MYLLTAPARRQHGVTLIEALITLLVLSVGLLGMAALQARSLQFNQDAHLRSQANVLLYDMAERCRALPGLGADFDGEHELWQAQVSEELPDGQGSADCAAGVCTLQVSWAGRRFLDDREAADDSRETLQLTVKVGVL